MNKVLFFLKKPRLIIVAGKGRATAKTAIEKVLSNHFKIGKDILIFDIDQASSFFIKQSRLPILLATHIGEYHPEREFFAGQPESAKEIIELARLLPVQAHLILNFDDETVREIKNSSRSHILTFGFGARTDMRVSDIILTQAPNPGTNFKINYQGHTVPIWLEKLFGKEQIYAALAAASVGEVLGLNLVEISEALKSYQGV